MGCQRIRHVHIRSFQWRHGSSSRLAFFRAVLLLTGIMSHYRESMISLWEDRCAHYVWSGALITVIVREIWGWLSAAVVLRLLCLCAHQGVQQQKHPIMHEYQVSVEDTWYSAVATDTWLPETVMLELWCFGAAEGIWRHSVIRSWNQLGSFTARKQTGLNNLPTVEEASFN